MCNCISDDVFGHWIDVLDCDHYWSDEHPFIYWMLMYWCLLYVGVYYNRPSVDIFILDSLFHSHCTDNLIAQSYTSMSLLNLPCVVLSTLCMLPLLGFSVPYQYSCESSQLRPLSISSVADKPHQCLFVLSLLQENERRKEPQSLHVLVCIKNGHEENDSLSRILTVTNQKLP